MEGLDLCYKDDRCWQPCHLFQRTQFEFLEQVQPSLTWVLRQLLRISTHRRVVSYSGREKGSGQEVWVHAIIDTAQDTSMKL